MKNVMLCGNPQCCPSIREDVKNKIMYIVEGDTKIAFNAEQIQNLTKYLNRR